ncbi:MAG: hypothetical protein BroJett031_23060 [Betaproteobacteria bacterium]|nr:MAG: hypothetical protein BroJett031_23060 [Betaproteobacteria bacterium]
MIPIYEQGEGRGIGHGLDTFLDRFDAICKEHLQTNRAKAFAFIFYDFVDQDLRRILKNQGVFTQLDRLAGHDLSVFYLHTGRRDVVAKFNTVFLSKLGVNDRAAPPCVVFFRFKKNSIEDVAIAQLDNADLVHGFHELYGVIERYIKNDVNQMSMGLRSLKWIKSGASLVTLEVFRAALKKALEAILF